MCDHYCAMNRHYELAILGLGESQRRLLHTLKRRGPLTLAEIGEDLELSPGTLRGHVNALQARKLVDRTGIRREGPGRPKVVYGLTEEGEELFPKGEQQLLVELVRYAQDTGNEEFLEDFFAQRVNVRREEALRRVSGLEGRARDEEVAKIFSEAGYMAEITGTGDDTVLRLCHCPLRSVVAVTSHPCQAEMRLLRELRGEDHERIAYIPDGDDSCSYRLHPEADDS
jgi:predicted ArsR family transcriptional regulator